MSVQGDLFGDRGADISPCERYRYRLWRRWSDGPTVLFAMLNPSTADALVDDRTLGRCTSFAQRLHAGGLEVVNLFAWRATDPRELRSAVLSGLDPVGPDNDAAIVAAAGRCGIRIAAWGAQSNLARMRRAEFVRDLLLRTPWEGRPRRLYALKLTSHGDPWHPLYLKGDSDLVVYAEASS